MWQRELAGGTEQPDDNPYAGPRASSEPALDGNESDQDEPLRTKHLGRESSLRVAGLLGLITAGFISFIILTIPPFCAPRFEWISYQHLAGMAFVAFLALVVAATSWGLFRLRNWGRWALTIMTTLPLLAALCGGFLLNHTENHGFRGCPCHDPETILQVSVPLSVLSCPILLPLMWSTKGRTVFSSGYSETIRRTSHLRLGCLGIMPALYAVVVGLASYFALLLTYLSMLLTVIWLLSR